MEAILALLAKAEKKGILTGGSDKAGNYAYVVMDSSKGVSVTVRPGGRASLFVAGEETNYDLTDESGEPATDFITSLSEAMVADNLDSKAEQLTDLAEEVGDETGEDDDDSDEEDSDDSDDSEEDEEASGGDDDGVHDSDNADAIQDKDTDDDRKDSEEDIKDSKDDDHAEEYEDEDTEEASVDERADMYGDNAEACDDDDFEDNMLPDGDDPLQPHELALMIDNMPAFVESFIESAAASDTLEPFSVDRYMRVINGGRSASNKTEIEYYGGSELQFIIGDNTVSAEYRTSNNSKTGNGFHGVLAPLASYMQDARAFDDLNSGVSGSKIDSLLTKLIMNLSTQDMPAIQATCVELNSAIGAYSLVNKSDRTFVWKFGKFQYSVGYRYDTGDNCYYATIILAGGNKGMHPLLDVKCDYMVSVAAAFAKCAAGLNSNARPNALLIGSREENFANLLMKFAIKLGYTGESDTRVRLKVADAKLAR